MEDLQADYAHCALVIVDFQNDTMSPNTPFEIPGTIDVLPALVELTKAFRKACRPIIHIVRGYLADGSNVDRCRRKEVLQGSMLFRVGTHGADFPDALKPTNAPPLDWERLLANDIQALGPYDCVIYKPRWGAFYRTPLENLLQDDAINTLIVCGCNYPNCPRTTIYEASERDFRLVLATDGMSGLYEQGLLEMAKIGVQLTDTSHIIKALETL